MFLFQMLSILLYLVNFGLTTLPPQHRITVVDALSKAPVVAVVVQVDAQLLYTDAQGKVELPAIYRSLSFSRIGYGALRLTEALKAGVDTVYLKPVAQELAEIFVKPPGPPVSLSSASNKLTGANPSYPGTQIAIWFESPDTLQAYQLRSVSIPVKEKFQAGYIRVGIHPKGADDTLFGSNLLPNNLVLTNESVTLGKRPVVQFDVTEYNLVLPAKGFYLVLDCLSSSVQEATLQPRMVSKKGPNKKGVSKGTAYIDEVVEQNGVATTQAVAVDQYPQFITSPVEGASRTWRRFSPKLPLRQLNPVVFGNHKIGAYNIAATVSMQPL